MCYVSHSFLHFLTFRDANDSRDAVGCLCAAVCLGVPVSSAQRGLELPKVADAVTEGWMAVLASGLATSPLLLCDAAAMLDTGPCSCRSCHPRDLRRRHDPAQSSLHQLEPHHHALSQADVAAEDSNQARCLWSLRVCHLHGCRWKLQSAPLATNSADSPHLRHRGPAQTAVRVSTWRRSA